MGWSVGEFVEERDAGPSTTAAAFACITARSRPSVTKCTVELGRGHPSGSVCARTSAGRGYAESHRIAAASVNFHIARLRIPIEHVAYISLRSATTPSSDIDMIAISFDMRCSLRVRGELQQDVRSYFNDLRIEVHIRLNFVWPRPLVLQRQPHHVNQFCIRAFAATWCRHAREWNSSRTLARL